VVRPLALLLLFAVLLVPACSIKTSSEDPPDPGVMRWEVIPNPDGASILTQATYEYDFESSARGIYAESHRACTGGIGGIGETCRSEPMLEVTKDGETIELDVESGWLEGKGSVASGRYKTGRSTLSLRNVVIDVASVKRSETVKNSSGDPYLAYLCARGTADLDRAGSIVGSLRFAIGHANRNDRDVDPPGCSADL
jgi:hypothetical protein